MAGNQFDFGEERNKGTVPGAERNDGEGQIEVVWVRNRGTRYSLRP